MKAEDYLKLFGWPYMIAPRVELFNGDMFSFDWSDADFIFANCCCFDEYMMERMYKKSLKCRKGTWFMTVTNKLPHVGDYNGSF